MAISADRRKENDDRLTRDANVIASELASVYHYKTFELPGVWMLWTCQIVYTFDRIDLTYG